jgi:cytochrome c biogenesis factor
MQDFYINLYYFFWTQSFFIAFFFLTLVCIVSWFINKSSNLFTTFSLLFILIIIFINFNNYYFLNVIPFYTDFDNKNFNTLLLNPVNKFHPPMLYCTVAFLFNHLFIYGILSKQKLSKVFTKIVFISNLSNNATILIVIILYTLYLGSWWALQEGSWGGWWNWDPSEVLGLVILNFFIILHHFEPKKNTFVTKQFSFYIYSLILMLLYVFIQLNFSLISHNFGITYSRFRFSYLFMVIIFLYTYLFYSFYKWIIFLSNLSQLWFNAKYLTVRPTLPQHTFVYFNTLKYFIIVTTASVYIVSFGSLISYFLWDIFGINSVNNFFWIYCVVVYLYSIIIVFFVRITILSIILIIYNIVLPGWIVPPHFLFVLRPNMINIMHFLIFIFLFIPNFFAINTTSYWFWNIDTLAQINFFNQLCITNTNFLLEYDWHKNTSTFISHNYISDFIPNLNNTSFSFVSQNFSYLLNKDVVYQILDSPTLFYNYFLVIEDNHTILLDFIFF